LPPLGKKPLKGREKALCIERFAKSKEVLSWPQKRGSGLPDAFGPRKMEKVTGKRKNTISSGEYR